MRILSTRKACITACLLGLASSPAWSANLIVENFDDLSVAVTNGWVINNQSSSPAGGSSWFQGNSGVFGAHSGAPTSYAAANFNNSSSGAISDWLIAPVVSLGEGFTVTFYTRTETGSPLPDRLQVRLSTNGASANVGSGPAAVGDFSMLLLDINSTYAPSGYPEGWTVQTITLSGLGGATSGRIAFRYLIDDVSINGNYIGVDTFSVQDAAVPEPATILLTGSMLGAVALVRRRKGVSQ